MSQSRFLSIVAMSYSVAFLSFGTIQAQVPPNKAPEQLSLADGKLTIEIPTDWKRVASKSPIILHEYRAPDERETSARITISSARGGVEPNIERWITQFSNAKRADAKVDKKQISGHAVHIVDLTGTFEEKTGGPLAPGPVTKTENHRLLGAIIETEKGDSIFIKMLGPKDTVEKLSGGLKKSLDSLKTK